ncbi:MAG: nicotinate-nucleotide diphosphorylase (carboxylating) [Verrucomicrobia bacterium SCN 57-15]|nr:MAG: nicotinate-nucleotide diphosphorylase (carboxylating) [Verrucomicrobia bacterium SCN 57-15]
MQTVSAEEISRAVRAALGEDLGSGDATTLATIPPDETSRAEMVAREDLTLAGISFAEETFRQLSPDIRFARKHSDSDLVTKGEVILEISGKTAPILSAERVALNFVQRLSGVASLTATFVKAIAGTGAVILDTRKTTPGWRTFEKYAVSCGGGKNHRIGLFDLILIKDNHLAALRDQKPNAVAAAVRLSRQKYPNLKVEVEADTLDQVEQALDAKADIILLDNMTCNLMREAVKLTAGRAKLEASGGVNLETVRAIAETGVDYISVGALTHSARAVDIALDFKA